MRRIYFKVCMFGFDSSTDCLLLSGSNLDASLTPQSKAALPDTAPTVRHHPTAPEYPTTRQPDSTDSTCKRTRVLTDQQPRQPPALHRPTPPRHHPTPPDTIRKPDSHPSSHPSAGETGRRFRPPSYRRLRPTCPSPGRCGPRRRRSAQWASSRTYAFRQASELPLRRARRDGEHGLRGRRGGHQPLRGHAGRALTHRPRGTGGMEGRLPLEAAVVRQHAAHTDVLAEDLLVWEGH